MEFLVAGFFLLVIGVVTWLVTLALFTRFIRENHKDLYEALGSPEFHLEGGAEMDTLAVIKFLFKPCPYSDSRIQRDRLILKSAFIFNSIILLVFFTVVPFVADLS